MRLVAWWRRSRFYLGWRCCDWCDHDRGATAPERLYRKPNGKACSASNAGWQACWTGAVMFTLATAPSRNFSWPDRYPGRAIEDRDLYAEASNEVGVASAWFEAICEMYPNKSIAN